MIANPAAVRSVGGRHVSDPGREKPSVTIDDPHTSDEGDEYEEEGSEANDDEYEQVDENGRPITPPPRERDGRERPTPGQQLRSQFESVYDEKKELLLKLARYAERKDEISRIIPNKAYNYQTDINELRQIVELCEGMLKIKQEGASNRMGVRALDNATKWMSQMVVAGNLNLFEPEDQFAVDGFDEEIAARIERGEFKDVHAAMWERLREKMGFLENPFLMWGYMFGGGLVTYNAELRNAYARGTRPDPRKMRAEEKRRREEQGGLDDPDVEDPETPIFAGAPRPQIEPGMSSKFAEAARARVDSGFSPTSIAGPAPMGGPPESDSDEEREDGIGVFSRAITAGGDDRKVDFNF